MRRPRVAKAAPEGYDGILLMADSPGRPGHAPITGPGPAVVRRPLVPPRRQSLGEEEAFPITASEIQAPRLPVNPPEQDERDEQDGAPKESPLARPRYHVAAIVFVVVAALGTLAAVRFYVAASHDVPAQE
jgi:hypothetical protein